MVSGPEADYLKTTAEFRALLALTEHPEIAEARLYTAEPDRTVRLGQAAVPVSGKKARS